MILWATQQESRHKDVVYFSTKSWDEMSNIGLSRARNKLGFGPDCDSRAWNKLGFGPDCDSRARNKLGFGPDCDNRARNKLGFGPDCDSRAWNNLGFGPDCDSRACNKLGFGPDCDSQQEELPGLSEECSQFGDPDAEMEEWLSMDESETGVQEMTDEDIISSHQASPVVNESEKEVEEQTGVTITHTKTEEAFTLVWHGWNSKLSNTNELGTSTGTILLSSKEETQFHKTNADYRFI